MNLIQMEEEIRKLEKALHEKTYEYRKVASGVCTEECEQHMLEYLRRYGLGTHSQVSEYIYRTGLRRIHYGAAERAARNLIKKGALKRILLKSRYVYFLTPR
jgi:hypothetical protein